MGKSNPILVEVKGKLYALAGLPFEPFDNLPKLSFEVYDPATLIGDVGTCLGSSQRMASSIVDFVSPITIH